MTHITIDMERDDAQELLLALDAARVRAMAAADTALDLDEDERRACCEEAGALGRAYDRIRMALK
jgi:hypothetical protein